MLVQEHDCDAVQLDFSESTYYSLDCETTGLYPYLGDRLFAITIATEKNVYYFNGLQDWSKNLLSILLDNKDKYCFTANGKFDLHFLAVEGLFVSSHLYDVLVNAKILDNSFMTYSLSDVAIRAGYTKSDIVEKHIREHRLYRVAKNGKRSPAYDKVPFILMKEYAEQDARITYDIGMKQLNQMHDWDLSRIQGTASMESLFQLESELLPVLFDMERRGVKIDVDYTRKALAHWRSVYEKCANDFMEATGTPFVDSNKTLAKVFTVLGIQAGVTEKGNPSFTDQNLANIDHFLAGIIRNYREAYKKCSTYFEPFLNLSVDGVIHPNFRQMGTATGRMSMNEPNLQQISNEEESTEEFTVRKCFIPDRDCFFLIADYKTMEYRALLDYAGEEKLLGMAASGLDLHEETGKLAGIPRKQAKTVSFLTLYGGGAAKLASQLGVSIDEGKRIKDKFFRALPKVKKFLNAVSEKAKSRGYVVNKYGLPSFFKDANFSYKATNYIVQGSCAHAMKKAMVMCHKFLENKKSKLVLSVHDELVFYLFYGEEYLIPDLKKIMESTWNGSPLTLEVDIEYGKDNYHEKKKPS